MIRNIRKLVDYLNEDVGFIHYLLHNSDTIEDEYDYEDDEDEDYDELTEELFDKKVKYGKVIVTRNQDHKDLIHTEHDPKDNANLIKARVKARTPSANLKRRQSMMVRKRKIDRDR